MRRVRAAWKEFLEVQHDVNLRVMRILEDMGIQIALPSRSVYIEGASSQTAPAPLEDDGVDQITPDR